MDIFIPEVMEEEVPTIVEPTYISNYSTDTLEEDLKKFDHTYNTTASIRQQLVDKLTPVVMKLNINTEVIDRDSAAALDSQMNVVKTFMDILNDSDKAIKSKVDMKSKQKDTEDNIQLAGLFVETLKEAHKTRADNASKSASIANVADDYLANRVADASIIISEGELRTDSTDLG